MILYLCELLLFDIVGIGMPNSIENRIVNYWSKRSHNFASIRINELNDDAGYRWKNEIISKISSNGPLSILDVGTGAGFFSVLLASEGHFVHGIDITPSMISEARLLAKHLNLDIDFQVMDAQKIKFPDNTFDVVVSRNLTWTLPDPAMAYAEWYRVLKPQGILLNYDADYASHVRSHSEQNDYVSSDSPYGHIGMTNELVRENDEITLEMDIGEKRPEWDMETLKKIGIKSTKVNREVGKQILKEYDLLDAPMFGIYAIK